MAMMPEQSEIAKKQALCLQCMACCKKVLLPLVYRAGNKRAEEFYKLRGFELVEYKGLLAIDLQKPCSHLTSKGCNRYKHRPAACRDYDGREDPLMKDQCLWSQLSARAIFEQAESTVKITVSEKEQGQ